MARMSAAQKRKIAFYRKAGIMYAQMMALRNRGYTLKLQPPKRSTSRRRKSRRKRSRSRRSRRRR